MSLQSLSKDELILVIQNLEKSIRDEYTGMKKDLTDLRWRYQYCYCEHTIKKCAVQGCKAKSISGKNLHETYKNCNQMYLCGHCSIERFPPKKWYGKWEKEVWYCDQHINNHNNQIIGGRRCPFHIDEVQTTPTSDRDCDSDN